MKSVKYFLLLSLALCAGASAQERSLQKAADPPKKGIRQRVFDKKFLTLTAINVGVSIVATRALVKCRADHGIGPCWDGGYGEFKTRETLRQALTGTLVLVSYQIKKIEDREDNKYKFWWTLQAFNTGWNSGALIRNEFHRFPPKEKE